MKKALKPSFHMADGPVLALGNAVITALTNNPLISPAQPTVAQLQAAVDAYTSSLSKAKYGSREDRALKKANKETLITLLRDECDYINGLAKGDPLTLSGCGFPLSKDPQPVVLGTPDAKVEQGASGKLILLTPGVTGAVSYKHKYKAEGSTAPWIEIITSKAICTIDGLTPGTVYSLQIEAIGRKDQVSISDVVTKMAA